MVCRVCGRRVFGGGSLASNGFCSTVCRDEIDRMGLAALAQHVPSTGVTADVPQAGQDTEPEEVPPPYFGEALRIRFEPLPYQRGRSPAGTAPPATMRAPAPAGPGVRAVEAPAVRRPAVRPVKPARKPAPDPPRTRTAPVAASPVSDEPARKPAPVSFQVLSGENAETEAKEGLNWTMIAASAALALTLGYFGVTQLILTPDSQAASAGSAGRPAALLAGWAAEWAESPSGDPIAVHAASLSWTDYRAEQTVSRYLGVKWVYRATDPENYLALELTPGKYGNVMRLRRYSVVNGAVLESSEDDVPAGEAGGENVTVLLELRGSKFRLILDGERAATWLDEVHPRGAFGVIGAPAEAIAANPVAVRQFRRGETSDG